MAVECAARMAQRLQDKSWSGQNVSSVSAVTKMSHNSVLSNPNVCHMSPQWIFLLLTLYSMKHLPHNHSLQYDQSRSINRILAIKLSLPSTQTTRSLFSIGHFHLHGSRQCRKCLKLKCIRSQREDGTKRSKWLLYSYVVGTEKYNIASNRSIEFLAPPRVIIM